MFLTPTSRRPSVTVSSDDTQIQADGILPMHNCEKATGDRSV